MLGKCIKVRVNQTQVNKFLWFCAPVVARRFKYTPCFLKIPRVPICVARATECNTASVRTVQFHMPPTLCCCNRLFTRDQYLPCCWCGAAQVEWLLYARSDVDLAQIISPGRPSACAGTHRCCRNGGLTGLNWWQLLLHLSGIGGNSMVFLAFTYWRSNDCGPALNAYCLQCCRCMPALVGCLAVMGCFHVSWASSASWPTAPLCYLGKHDCGGCCCKHVVIEKLLGWRHASARMTG